MNKRESANPIIIVSIVGLIIIGFGGYRFYLQYQTLKEVRAELATTTAELLLSKEENKFLSNALETEKYKNSLFGKQISDIAGTVGALDKLSKTDKELLQKYSKVYFLNEHYIPENLATITSDFLYQKTREQYVHAKVWPFLERLLKDAKSSGNELLIISAFRSFGEQGSLKGNYTFTYGSGANKFSADQGYSEHQLGTALDFTTPKIGAGFDSFKDTDSYKWLLANAYKYGFILSYPEKNSYYQFEPWHWRFVGIKLADKLHTENGHFYDLDQRIIDNYLINIFD